jgi:hypothetical protein
MVLKSCLEGLPAIETILPCDQFLRIAELETLHENLGIVIRL